MVISSLSSTFQILNAFWSHFLACRTTLGKVREVVDDSYESKGLGFIFILWREDVLWTFVKNQISGEVCGTSGERILTRNFRVFSLVQVKQSSFTRKVLTNWVSSDWHDWKCSSVLTFLWDTETSMAVDKCWWTWFSCSITAWWREGNSCTLLETGNLKEYENEWKTRVEISFVRANLFSTHTFIRC